MKKLVFTAIAVVAFSGVSMAETREVKSNSNVVTEQLEATPCEDNALNIYNYVMETYNCGGDDIDLLNALLANCR